MHWFLIAIVIVLIIAVAPAKTFAGRPKRPRNLIGTQKGE